jgi:hypothetical protein
MLTTTATRGEEDQAASANAADDLILEEMRDRYLLWLQQDAEFLKNSDEELEFGAGDHWQDKEGGRDVRQELQSKGRSAMTIDLLNPSIELVVNPMRINKPMPKFMPVGEGAQQATADVRQGLYRNIDRESRAAVARETAHDFAVRCGRGYYQVLIEDEEGLNFDKRIRIQRIDDLGVVMMDQTCIEPDYSDAEWGGIWDDLSKREFRNQYGDIVDNLDTAGISLPEPDRDPWFKSNSIRRLVYFRRNWFTNTVAKLPDVDPRTNRPYLDQAGKPIKFLLIEEARARGIQPVSVLKKRDYKIQRFEASGTQILRRMDWPGKWIPIIVMVGREVFRGRRKKKIHSGMIRPAMDVSRVHNFAESRLIDEVALSPLPHMMAAAGQLDPSQQKIVNEINIHPWSVVEYTLKHAPDGTQIPRPEWVSPSPNLGAVVQAAAHAKDNLQRVLNTYSPQLGQMQADQSGRAIREVKDQGDISHAAFPDNATRALLHEARIVNDLMDYVYSDARAITITEPDDNTKRVLINQEYTDQETGERVHHLFGAGKYDVAMGTEQAYPTRLAEAADKLLDMAKVIPALNTQAPDLLVQAIGLPGLLGQKIADRLRPPGIDDKNPLPPIAQQKLAQMQKMIQMLVQEMNQMSELIKQKRLELGSNEKIAIIKAWAALVAADFKYGSEEAQLQFKAALDLMGQRAQQLDSNPETANPEPTPPAGAAPAPSPGAPAPGAPAPSGPPNQPGPGAPPSQLAPPAPGGQQ